MGQKNENSDTIEGCQGWCSATDAPVDRMSTGPGGISYCWYPNGNMVQAVSGEFSGWWDVPETSACICSYASCYDSCIERRGREGVSFRLPGYTDPDTGTD